MIDGLPPGGRLLDKQPVQINSWRIIPAAVIGVGAGNVAHIESGYYLQVIDLATGVGLVIPYDQQALTDLQANITKIIEGSNTNATE